MIGNKGVRTKIGTDETGLFIMTKMRVFDRL